MASRSGKGGGSRRVDIPSAGRTETRRGSKPKSAAAKKPKKAFKKSSRRKDSRKKRGSLLGVFVKGAVLAAIWGGVSLGGVIGWYAIDLPDIDRLSAATRRPSITILDRAGGVIATFGDL